jgi:hypothetical protein
MPIRISYKNNIIILGAQLNLDDFFNVYFVSYSINGNTKIRGTSQVGFPKWTDDVNQKPELTWLQSCDD